jgi:hypothetical protein
LLLNESGTRFLCRSVRSGGGLLRAASCVCTSVHQRINPHMSSMQKNTSLQTMDLNLGLTIPR